MQTVIQRRRFWVAGLVVIPVVATAYYFWAGDHSVQLQVEPEPAFTLEELCRDSFTNGWRVKHEPDLPGPYRRRPSFLYYHPGRGGSCTVRLRTPAGEIIWEERTRPGGDFLTLVLETSDGRRTEGLLVRGE